jgi:branched-chain amino acid transport system permease protein
MEVFVQLVINSLITGAIYVLIALSFNFIYGATKFFNLAHGSIAAVGGYAVFLLAHILGLSMALSVILGVIIAGLVGFGLEKIVYLPLRRKKATTLILLVASLGVMTVIQALIQIGFGSQFRTLSDITKLQPIYEIFNGVITQTQLILIATSIIVTIGLIIFVNKTLFGKAVKAISDDEEVAKIVGINTNKIIGIVFFIGSAVVGLAGILLGFDIGIEPFMALKFLLKGIIAAVVGGIGSLYGAVLGGLLLSFTENFGIWKISAEWKDTIAFLLLIIFLIFRPRGIMNK